jgi:hypothetical protein
VVGAVDLGVEVGDPGAKDNMRALRTEGERVARELSQPRVEFPSTGELMPRLRGKFREFEATLKAGVTRGRLALGGLLGNPRLRVYRNARIEGAATLSPEMFAAPRRTSEPRVRVVAGERYAPDSLPIPLMLPVLGQVNAVTAVG